MSDARAQTIGGAKETTFNKPFDNTCQFQLWPFRTTDLWSTPVIQDSDEVTVDSMNQISCEVGKDVGGSMLSNLHLGLFNLLIESNMWNLFTTESLSVTGTVTTGGNSIVASAGDFDDLKDTLNKNLPRFVNITGFVDSLNNGIKKVSSVSATGDTIVFADAGAVNSDEGPLSIGVGAQWIRSGENLVSMCVERKFKSEFTVTDSFHGFTGVVANELIWNFQSRAIATLQTNFLGGFHAPLATVTNGDGSEIAIPDRPLIKTKSDVTYIITGMLGAPTVMDMTLTNNGGHRARPAQGEEVTIRFGQDRRVITGTLNLYFTHHDQLVELLINDGSVAIEILITDSDGRITAIRLTSLTFTEARPAVGGQNSEVILPINFTCQKFGRTISDYDIQLDFLDPTV